MTTDMEKIAFVGDTLGVLFRFEPLSTQARPLVETFAEVDATELAKEWPFGAQEDLQRGFELMGKTDVSNEALMDEYVWEFRRLFEGPGHVAVPPWGSVYTDRDCVVFGRATLELREWMKSKGINRLEEEKNPEDHIGTMLLLMSWIARNKPDCLDEFLSDHLLPWADHMLAQLEEESKVCFYQGLAVVTRASLMALHEELGLVVKKTRFFR